MWLLLPWQVLLCFPITERVNRNEPIDIFILFQISVAFWNSGYAFIEVKCLRDCVYGSNNLTGTLKLIMKKNHVGCDASSCIQTISDGNILHR